MAVQHRSWSGAIRPGSDTAASARAAHVARRPGAAPVEGPRPVAVASPGERPPVARLAAAPRGARTGRRAVAPAARAVVAVIAIALALALAGLLAGPAPRSDRLAPFRWQPVTVGVG